jgi:hypothetical protein
MFVVNAVNNTVGATVGAMGQSVKQLRKTFAGSDLLEGGEVSLEDVILYTAVDKAHLTIKCTPAKNLSCTSALAVRQGPLLKKNEQGQWHTVTACLVPHWFLYYYDDDKEDSPKGIIDMHLYTNTHIDDYPKEKSIWKNKNGDGKTQHVLTLKVDEINARDRRGNPATNSNLKPYYFGSEDKAELLNWTQCINRDRYNGTL